MTDPRINPPGDGDSGPDPAQVSDAVAMLEAELASLSIDSDDDAMIAIALSARLAALGQPDRLDALAASFVSRESIARSGAARAAEGVEDLDLLEGEELALALVEAADWHSARSIHRRLAERIRQDAEWHRALDRWIESADQTVLDDAAASFLRDWISRFPIAPSLRLAPFLAPIGETEALALVAATRPVATVALQSDGRSPHASAPDDEQRTELRLAADGAMASPAECRLFERQGKASIASNEIRARMWLEESRDLRVVLDVTGEPPVAVCLGGWPLERIEGEPHGTSVWEASLRRMGWQDRHLLVRADLHIRLADGHRLRLGVEPSP